MMIGLKTNPSHLKMKTENLHALHGGISQPITVKNPIGMSVDGVVLLQVVSVFRQKIVVG